MDLTSLAFALSMIPGLTAPEPFVVRVQPNGAVSFDGPGATGHRTAAGDIATVEIGGRTAGGKELFDTRKRGLSYTFRVGSEEPDLTWMTLGMAVGQTRTVWLPSLGSAVGEGLMPPGPAILRLDLVAIRRP